MSSEKSKKPFEVLLVRLLENDITDKEIECLNKWIEEDPKSIAKYCDFLQDYAIIQKLVTSQIDRADSDLEDTGFDKAMWAALSEFEKNAPEIEVERPVKMPKVAVVREPVRYYQPPAKFSKFRLYTLVASVAAVFLMIFYLRMTPPNASIEVATITDMIDVKWADSTISLETGDRLLTHYEPLSLSRGFVEIQTDRGVTLTIEGPAEFEIMKEADLYLNYGRLYAKVSQQGLGFTVSTANSKVIDLGTEFGVKADLDETELHVMRGKTVLISGAPDRSKKQYEISKGQAKTVDSNGAAHDIALGNEDFVRTIDSATRFIWKGQKQMNLADIIGGGDGFATGKIDMGIEYNGQIQLLDTYTSQEGPSDYIPVASNVFIDGVFVPNGLSQIDSSGTIYQGFESTNSKYWLGILNGAWHRIELTVDVPRHQLRLNGQMCGTPDNPAIYMSANQGVTFDLQAMRDYTKMQIAEFTSLCGVSETYREYWNIMKRYKYFRETPNASFYVLVDGQPRFVRKEMTPDDAAAKISIALRPEDRFLTLVTTQGSDNTNDGDWTLFAAPSLVLHE